MFVSYFSNKQQELLPTTQYIPLQHSIFGGAVSSYFFVFSQKASKCKNVQKLAQCVMDTHFEQKKKDYGCKLLDFPFPTFEFTYFNIMHSST